MCVLYSEVFPLIGVSFITLYSPTLHREDPYEKTLMNRFLHQSRMTQSSSEDIPLQKTALETLYDDDEIVDTAQTMPWFDPTYLAENVSSREVVCSSQT